MRFQNEDLKAKVGEGKKFQNPGKFQIEDEDEEDGGRLVSRIGSETCGAPVFAGRLWRGKGGRRSRLRFASASIKFRRDKSTREAKNAKMVNSVNAVNAALPGWRRDVSGMRAMKLKLKMKNGSNTRVENTFSVCFV